MAENKALASILRYVRGAFQGPVDRVEVRHIHADGSEARVGSLSGERITGKTVTPDSIADELYEQIETDAKLWRGASRYVVLFYRPGEREYCARCPIVVKSDPSVLRDSVEDGEPATEKGLAAMAMRHMEGMMSRMNAQSEMIMRYMEARDSRNTELITRAMDQQVRVLTVEQDLIDRKDERALRVKREEKTDKLVEKGVEQVMMLLGPLASKILPGTTGQQVSSDMMTIQLLASLKPEQIQALAQILDPQQGAVFLELYKNLSERYAKVKISDETKTEHTNGEQKS